MINKTFKDTKVIDFDPGEEDYAMLSDVKMKIDNSAYFDFIIDSQNGGFFYQQGIHVYGYSKSYDFHNVNYINACLADEYGKIFKDLLAFAQDLFGNQFCFDLENSNIIYFESETGERQVIASTFPQWLTIVENDKDYYAGIELLKQWTKTHAFPYNYRLCPKIPFIMGGEYVEDNLYSVEFPVFIRSYANIAKQVYGLPDGTPVKLVINKNTE